MMNKYLKYFQHISISRQFLQSEKEYLHNHAVRAVQPTRLLLLKNYYTKGQLISKCLFGIFNSPEKRTKKIRLYYYGTSSRIVFVHFLGELKTPKKTFRN